MIAGYLLFVPPFHGLADNGDFYRAQFVNGLYHLKGYSMLDYVTPKLGIMQYYNDTTAAVFSSQPIFVKLAILLNKLFYSKTVFDLRFMGLVYYVPYLGSMYLLTMAMTAPYRKLRSYLIALLIVFVFADSSFTLYFNSFFAEPGMLILMLYAFASLMLVARRPHWHPRILTIVYFVSIMLLIANKQQNAPLALSYVVTSIGLFFIFKKRAQWLWILGGIVGILVTGVLTYTLITKQFNDINQYQAFTHEGSVTRTIRARRIAKQGVDEQYALMRNQDYYPKILRPLIRVTNPSKRAKRQDGARLDRLVLRITIPSSALLDVAAGDMMITQVKAVGDYQKASGKPAGAQVTYFTGFSSVAGAFFPQKFSFDILLTIALLIVFLIGAYNDLVHHRVVNVVRFFLVTGLLTVFIFVPIISIIGDGMPI